MPKNPTPWDLHPAQSGTSPPARAVGPTALPRFWAQRPAAPSRPQTPSTASKLINSQQGRHLPSRSPGRCRCDACGLRHVARRRPPRRTGTSSRRAWRIHNFQRYHRARGCPAARHVSSGRSAQIFRQARGGLTTKHDVAVWYVLTWAAAGDARTADADPTEVTTPTSGTAAAPQRPPQDADVTARRRPGVPGPTELTPRR